MIDSINKLNNIISMQFWQRLMLVLPLNQTICVGYLFQLAMVLDFCITVHLLICIQIITDDFESQSSCCVFLIEELYHKKLFIYSIMLGNEMSYLSVFALNNRSLNFWKLMVNKIPIIFDWMNFWHSKMLSVNY